jgi:hypothetical protein
MRCSGWTEAGSGRDDPHRYAGGASLGLSGPGGFEATRPVRTAPSRGSRSRDRGRAGIRGPRRRTARVGPGRRHGPEPGRVGRLGPSCPGRGVGPRSGAHRSRPRPPAVRPRPRQPAVSPDSPGGAGSGPLGEPRTRRRAGRLPRHRSTAGQPPRPPGSEWPGLSARLLAPGSRTHGAAPDAVADGRRDVPHRRPAPLPRRDPIDLATQSCVSAYFTIDSRKRWPSPGPSPWPLRDQSGCWIR